jgi:hypothetical protein
MGSASPARPSPRSGTDGFRWCSPEAASTRARLTADVLWRLEGAHRVELHREVPPGDGEFTLGQALVADAKEGA